VDAALGIVYDARPGVTDDLSSINGIGEQIARELNDLGVFRFKQIARWTDANLVEFARRLFCQRERIERDKWVPQAKRLHRLVYRASAEWTSAKPDAAEMQEVIRTEFGGQSVRADEDLGIIYTEAPARPDSLGAISGIDARIEKELNAAGVWRFLQVARWASHHAESFAGRLRIPVEALYRAGWIPEAQALAGATSLAGDEETSPGKRVVPEGRASSGKRSAVPSKPVPEPVGCVELTEPVAEMAPVDDEMSVVEVAPAVETPPVAEPPPVVEVAPLPEAEAEAPLPVPPSGTRAGIVVHPDWGEIYTDRPDRIDDLTQIVGITAPLERRLHLFRVYRYWQIAKWTSEQVEAFAFHLGIGERIALEGWVEQAGELAQLVAAEEEDREFVPSSRIDYQVVVREHFGEESVLRIDPRLGVLFDQRPGWVDELTKIEGIGPVFQRRLHQAGVYQFRQVANWSREVVEGFADMLNIPAERIFGERWVVQARRLDLEAVPVETEWGDRQPDMAELRSRAALEFPGEDIEVDEAYGIVFVGRPGTGDDLRKIKGIGVEFEEALHSVGVWRYRQIACWGTGNIQAFARLLRTRRQRIQHERWIGQARELAAQAARPARGTVPKAGRSDGGGGQASTPAGADESLIETADMGLIYTSPPREVDDLRRIKGIGGMLENSLNDHGVYRFRQIALWTERHAEEFARRLNSFGGRILREGWREQARRLHVEKYGGEP
jgi:predicted flap endonuclease-1-like 5' DNA nuclease